MIHRVHARMAAAALILWGAAVAAADGEPVFVELHANPEPGFNPHLLWADYDLDGDLDLFVTDGHQGVLARARLYENVEGRRFEEASQRFASRKGMAVALDYDLDGGLEIVLATRAKTRIVEYDPYSGFEFRSFGSEASRASIIFTGDVDNDGDADAWLSGEFFGPSGLYRNVGGDPQAAGQAVRGLMDGGGGWTDYDRDGDLDLTLSGVFISPSYHFGLSVYENTPSGLRERLSLDREGGGVAEWLDFDGDGDLELLCAGGRMQSTSGAPCYEVNGTEFTLFDAGLPELLSSNVDWTDWDADGDLDLLNGPEVFVREGDEFVRKSLDLPTGTVAWADFDHDGDLDVAIVGQDGTRIFERAGSSTNRRPLPPTGLRATWSESSVAFEWDAGRDHETLETDLTYELRVGTFPGASDVVAARAHPITGERAVHEFGNLRTLAWTLRDPPRRALYWSVQTIDGGKRGSEFASQHATSPHPGAPVEAAVGTLAYPNPFHEAATVRFLAPVTGEVRVEIVDLAGRRVRKLADQPRPAGAHTVSWDGRDDAGDPVVPGVYYCHVRGEGWDRTVRLVHVK